MEQLIITAPSKRVADQIRRFVATLDGVSVGSVIFDRPKPMAPPTETGLLTTEQLAATIATGLQEIREIQEGSTQAVSLQSFMKDGAGSKD